MMNYKTYVDEKAYKKMKTIGEAIQNEFENIFDLYFKKLVSLRNDYDKQLRLNRMLSIKK